MPFFSDYGHYHGSAPFSSQYYSQLLPYPGSNLSRPISRIQPRNYNSIVVEQTLRAIRRGPGAIAARHYARPVHINASEIDVTSPRRPQQLLATETVTNDNAGGNIHRGRTVVRLHTKNKRTEKSPMVVAEPENYLPESTACISTVFEEGLAKKGTIKRHMSVGVKVPVNDDRRPSVTDDILREQEALFDTMILEEMEVQKERRKSYPVDTDDKDNKKVQKNRETRKKSIPAGMIFSDPEKPVKKTNWKLNYDVIIEESGIEPVSFTFKLNKTKQDCGGVDVSSDNGKLDANHNVVIKPHDDNNNEKKNIKKHVNTINKNQTNNDNSDDVCMLVNKKKVVVKKKIIVKKKVIKKKESGKQEQNKQPQEQEQGQQKIKLQTPSPPKSKKKDSKTDTAAAVTTATAAVITPFVRASFGKTFISPSQVSSTKSKFEKPKPKVEQKSSPPPLTAKLPSPSLDSSSDEDESSSDEDTSSMCSSSTGSSSNYYDSDDYGDKRLACSISSFDSGLPSSPVLAPDPIGRINIINTNNKPVCVCVYVYVFFLAGRGVGVIGIAIRFYFILLYIMSYRLYMPKTS